ncbi:MAG: asparagine synthase (glutamine-hydrolyzing) [Alteromonadaceae bacterium]|nr:asparagine synthase (glutamine-hydrolyzing) [Alteromonadaceae bacterium]
MCGIAGWFSNQSESKHVADLQLQNMIDAIAYRGPDGQGKMVFSEAYLAHCRLSIIDVENGSQPMLSPCGKIAITFNGEIYNYRSLKAQLQRQGEVFLTESDTEVILRLYEQQGTKAFSLLRGMFALVIWDDRNKTAHLARDPNGIKPLFYHSSQGQLLFASEAKAILAKTKSASLNEGSLHFLMNLRYLPDTRSLFKDIEQIAPGQILTWRPNTNLEYSYFDYSHESHSGSEGVLAALSNSVKHHLVADVEVGCYLSGGIDSALISSLAKQGLAQNQRLQTFTLDVGDDVLEAQNAAETAKLLDIDNRQLKSENYAQQNLKSLIWHLEVPKVNSLQVFNLASHASKHVKVTLSGLGGDELFLGYNAHDWMAKATSIHNTLPFASSLVKPLVGLPGLFSKVPYGEPERLLRLLAQLPCFSQVYGLLRNVWDLPEYRNVIYGPRMLDQSLPDVPDWLTKKWQHANDPVISMRNFEWQQKLVNDLLWQEDRCSMAHGLEVRVPFVDSEMRNSVWHMNRSQLMPNNIPKGLMKQAISPLLPTQILNRKKSGFQVNSATFFKTELAGLAQEYLHPDVVKKYGIFNPTFVANIRRLPPRGSYKWHFFMLYLMIGTHIWLELFETP